YVLIQLGFEGGRLIGAGGGPRGEVGGGAERGRGVGRPGRGGVVGVRAGQIERGAVVAGHARHEFGVERADQRGDLRRSVAVDRRVGVDRERVVDPFGADRGGGRTRECVVGR